MGRSAHGVGRRAALVVAVGTAMAATPAAHAASGEAAFPCPPLPAPGYCGDDGPALSGGFGTPADIAVRRNGGYLVADATNNAIRAVEAGRITTVAGAGVRRGSRRATRVHLDLPSGVAALGNGGMLVADTGGDRVLEIHPGRRVRNGRGRARTGRCRSRPPLRACSSPTPGATASS